MKKYYQSRIMLSAMLSFLIILVITVAAIWFISYQRIERDSDNFIESRLTPLREGNEGEGGRRFEQDAPPMFGYNLGRRSILSGFYEITFTPDGEVERIIKRGIAEDADTSMQEYVMEAVQKKIEKGKIGSYRYGIRWNADGSGKVILVDIYSQMHTLYAMLLNAGKVAIGIFILLVIVLFPVSGRMADAFVRNAEQQRRFITDAGHDLKTPVAIARANLDVLELREGRTKWSDNIRAQVDRMEHLVQDLIMMARLEEDPKEQALDNIELTAMTEEIWHEYQPSLKQKGITGETALEETPPVKGSENLIRRMFCLLMDNAVQYTPEGGTIRLAVKPEKKKNRIVLANSVLCLPTEKPEKLTERFVRGDSARTQKSGGSGIGLAAVRRIVEKHKGKLTVDYPDEHTFRVTVEI